MSSQANITALNENRLPRRTTRGILMKESQRTLLTAAMTLAITALSAFGAVAASLSEYGVVLMHGKGGVGGNPYISGLAHAMRGAGAEVIMPDMPWAKQRMYDATYEQAMAQIDTAVKKLRADGKTKIVVGGQSFGANAAMGYAVRHEDLAAVLALAPGHVPESSYFLRVTKSSIEKAKSMIVAGKHQRTQFADTAQGHDFKVSATPEVYLSFFDPEGPANIQASAKAMKAVPIFMAVGSRDPLSPYAHEKLFEPAAKNPKSKYVALQAGHMDTPEKVKAQVVSWLAGFSN
jgi:pimeloyl-ACP methyl ester carboxylesterase